MPVSFLVTGTHSKLGELFCFFIGPLTYFPVWHLVSLGLHVTCVCIFSVLLSTVSENISAFHISLRLQDFFSVELLYMYACLFTSDFLVVSPSPYHKLNVWRFWPWYSSVSEVMRVTSIFPLSPVFRLRLLVILFFSACNFTLFLVIWECFSPVLL